jgi:quercetin dioxygenase-like cupin family protein
MTLPLYGHAKDEGQAIWFLGTLTIIKATGEQTGGAFSLVEQLFPPNWSTPYHVHRVEDEAFWILEGEATFISGNTRLAGGPGQYLFLPRDIPHGFRTGPAPSRMLVLTAPAGFEKFVLELGEPAKARTLPPPSGPPNLERLIQVAARYRIEALGPLPE